MLPVVLIHGYSSEGDSPANADYSRDEVAALYGTLPAVLAQMNVAVVPINVSRYISLDDGIDVEDISTALHRALLDPANAQLANGFNAIVHSTGALVIRNWVRRFGKDPVSGALTCPLKRIIYLAGANFGSGWAHIGESLLAKWGRKLFVGGTECGDAVLDQLELASNWAAELHLYFLKQGQRMFEDYGVMEFGIIGSEPPSDWAIIPIRYGKEEGSDGVVRVSATNLNFNYLKIEPAKRPPDPVWSTLKAYCDVDPGTPAAFADGGGVFDGDNYQIAVQSRPGAGGRGVVPFAIVYATAHSGATGIVTPGTDQVHNLIGAALQQPSGTYQDQVANFSAATASTLNDARAAKPVGLVDEIIDHLLERSVNHESPYNAHAQLVFRLWDQFGVPINDFSVYFNDAGGSGQPAKAGAVNSLFEDTHKNDKTPNTICFYLRLTTWNGQDWQPLLPALNGVDLEIDATDPKTGRALYLPLRMRLTSDLLQQWVVPNQTTIIDMTLLRVPGDDVFLIR